jgi:hypothetical protein
MKVLVNSGSKVVFDIGLLEALARGIVVEQKGYGKEARFLPTNDTIDFEIIRDNQLITEETETVEILRSSLKETEDAKSKEWMKAYTAENENKKLKEEIATLKSVCPHPAKPTQDNEVL